MDESGMPAILLARLKIEENAISELELYINRSRADSGFLFQPEAVGRLPQAWTSHIPEEKRATREELAVGFGGALSPQESRLCQYRAPAVCDWGPF